MANIKESIQAPCSSAPNNGGGEVSGGNAVSVAKNE